MRTMTGFEPVTVCVQFFVTGPTSNATVVLVDTESSAMVAGDVTVEISVPPA